MQGQPRREGAAWDPGPPLRATGEGQERSRGRRPDLRSPPPLLRSFNTDTMRVDTNCSCCRPLSSHEKQLVLPCPDPKVRGRQLTLTLQLFSRCTCRSQRCGD
ncbi:hypothetical protein EI555_019005 [Monodon monoceros]|uniref:CTCK domain-containing protein n=1 Tax=Monodon monoceros TaxID=40151 RepID=A0A4U1EP53_MONMO|nr:hypothetical protein EI555_019005 [Monodon monoceros]